MASLLIFRYTFHPENLLTKVGSVRERILDLDERLFMNLRHVDRQAFERSALLKHIFEMNDLTSCRV